MQAFLHSVLASHHLIQASPTSEISFSCPFQIRRHAAFVSPSTTVTTITMQRKRLHPRTKLLQSLYNENFEKSPTRNEQRIQRQLAKIWNHEFVPLSLAGRCSQVKNNVPIDFLLLADAFDSQIISNIYNSHLQSKNPSNECINALPLPLSPNDTSSLRLLSHAYASTTPSKTTILRLNSLFINRDGGLFDNLPWNTWSIDPDRKERDASNNVAEAKFSMGKRVGFWRFMGVGTGRGVGCEVTRRMVWEMKSIRPWTKRK
jgi:hypothetical protein